MAQPQYPVLPTSSQVPGSSGPYAYSASQPVQRSTTAPAGYQSLTTGDFQPSTGGDFEPRPVSIQTAQPPRRSSSASGFQYSSQVPELDDHETSPLFPKQSARTPRESKENLGPADTVYSGILFLPAISRLESGTEMNRHARLAFLLCILNAVIQMGVVRVINIYDHSEGLADDRALMSIRDLAANGNNAVTQADKEAGVQTRRAVEKVHVNAMRPDSTEVAELEDAHAVIPLCHRIGEGNGTFSCMPYSVKYVFEWKHLDTNGDGVWSSTEAKADVAGLKAKYDVSPESIFNNIINGLVSHSNWMKIHENNTLYLTRSLQNDQAIPKAYFDFWQGDAMMCTFFDSNSCEAAAKSGVFEAALKPGRLSARAKGISDLDSAIAYCYRMLEPGGMCESALPTDFKRNREQRWERCGTRQLGKGGKYVNPYDTSQAVNVLDATYSSVSAYQRATSMMYMFFLSLIIMLWLWSLIDEVQELIRFGEFLWVFPGIKHGEPSGEIVPPSKVDDDEEGNSYTVFGISKKHRAVLALIYLIRILVCVVLTVFGTHFLLVEEDYLDLVLNSLALTFILEVDVMLFSLVEKDVSSEMQRCKPLVYTTRLPTSGLLGYTFKKECWGLFLVPILAFVLVIRYTIRNKVPVLTALTCACQQEGEKCLDSMSYQSQWWNDYWSHVLPAAIHQINAMRVAGI